MDILSENSFVGALASGILLIIIISIWNLCLKKYRANQVYKILKAGLQQRNKDFLPTTYLSAETGYTQSQIEEYCSHHKNIRRNEKELASWRIIQII